MVEQIKLFEKTSDGMDEELEKCESSLQNGGDRTYIKLKDGPDGNKIRFLPPLVGQKTPWYHVKVHFGLMGSDGKKLAILCGYKNFDDCALCREADIYRQQGDNLKAWNVSAKDYYLYNVLDERGNYCIYSADKRAQEELIKQFKFARSVDGGEFNPWDIENGCYIKIVKTKGEPSAKQKYPPNKYAAHLLKQCPIDEAILALAEKSMYKLEEVYKIYKPKEIEGILNGTFDPKAEKDKANQKTATPKPTIREASDDLEEEEGKKVDNLDEALDTIKNGGSMDAMAASILEDDDSL